MPKTCKGEGNEKYRFFYHERNNRLQFYKAATLKIRNHISINILKILNTYALELSKV